MSATDTAAVPSAHASVTEQPFARCVLCERAGRGVVAVAQRSKEGSRSCMVRRQASSSNIIRGVICLLNDANPVCALLGREVVVHRVIVIVAVIIAV
jgi:hypothetical protein